MLDIKEIRNNPQLFKDGLAKRKPCAAGAIDALLEADAAYRKHLAHAETLRAERKTVASEVALIKAGKKEGEAEPLMTRAAEIKNELQDLEKSIDLQKSEIDAVLLSIPNIPDISVPLGEDETHNKVISVSECELPRFNFKPLDHHSLGERLGILDFETAALLSGSRFSLLKGQGAKLERALINFMVDLHTTKHGYTEIMTPMLVNRSTLTGTGQLPKFEEDLYKTAGEEEMFLIPTAEVTLTNLFKGKILNEKDLNKQFTAFTSCFRKEAGTYGKDTRGLIRNHQFNKVELVWLTKPDDSAAALETLIKHAQEVLKQLELPYRVVELCTGDIGFSAAKTYDLEVWMPSENTYREISSCSNCTNFQARRMNTRFKTEKGTEFIHTLNGSGLAVGRTFAAILENFQNEDGTINIPKKLVPYFGSDKIK